MTEQSEDDLGESKNTSFVTGFPIPWWVIRRQRRRRLMRAADTIMDRIIAATPEARGGAYSVTFQCRPLGIVVGIEGDSPVPAFIPEVLDGFPIILNRCDRRYFVDEEGPSEKTR